MSKQALKVEDPETNATPLQDNIVSGVESSATSSSMVSRKGKAAGKEKARWADDAGYQLAEIQNGNLEILVDNGSLATTSDGADIEEVHSANPNSRELLFLDVLSKCFNQESGLKITKVSFAWKSGAPCLPCSIFARNLWLKYYLI
jgi:hypothetical protein